jgi:hypothetical protein
MKKYQLSLYALLIGLSAFAFKPGDIDKKVVQSFSKGFPAAQNISWRELDDSYVVSFVENGVRSKLRYQKDGTATEFTRFYQEENLPLNVQYKVKKKFPDKKIFGVTEDLEITEAGDYLTKDYFIKLEDDKSWITVKMDGDGRLSVVEKFKKAL